MIPEKRDQAEKHRHKAADAAVVDDCGNQSKDAAYA